MNKKYVRNSESRDQKIRELKERLDEQILKYNNPTQWLAYLDFSMKFYTYSSNNIMLLHSQKPEATLVAGYRKWQELGRQVIKGEKALTIFAYRERLARPGEKTDKTNEDGEPVIPYYPMVKVFDISQTEPTEKWIELTAILGGEDEKGIYPKLKRYLESQGWEVLQEDPGGLARGITSPGNKKIKIDPTLSPKDKTNILLHEAAHAILHTGPAKTNANKEVKECEAESVAYIVAGVLGMDTKDVSINYIANWTKKNKEVLEKAAENIIKGSRTILNAINPNPA